MQKCQYFLFLLFVLLIGGMPVSTVSADEAEIGAARVTQIENEAKTLPGVQSEEPILRKINTQLFKLLFLDVSFGAFTIPEVDRSGAPVRDLYGVQKIKSVAFPLVVAVLAIGAVFFTFFYSFINIRAFKHSIRVIAGHFDKADDAGEITHFRALTSALSATVGLGNIAGVAVAIQVGGPGAVLWMIIMALFGMSSKFSCCTLSQLFRKVNPDGTISGGPMYYLDIGFKQLGGLWAPFGKMLAVIFAVMVMGGSIGGGNMFQANQTAEAFRAAFGWSDASAWYIGIGLAITVGLVIIGGIKRIGYATSRIVPLMCITYVCASLFVILTNVDNIVPALHVIFSEAFTNNSFFGGVVGVLVTGVQRAAFSNEAGLGSAAIVHAAAKTDEPVREGIVAMIEPFIDTVVICLMTALVVVITGTYSIPELAEQGGNIGVTITSEAFRTVIPWFPYVLTICICLFAYSTMIAWCYYGERGWIYLLDHFDGRGQSTLIVFRILFICMIVVGAVNSASDVIDFTDAMILSMAIPNIIGMIILAPTVKPHVKNYMSRLRSGVMLERQ